MATARRHVEDGCDLAAGGGFGPQGVDGCVYGAAREGRLSRRRGCRDGRWCSCRWCDCRRCRCRWHHCRWRRLRRRGLGGGSHAAAAAPRRAHGSGARARRLGRRPHRGRRGSRAGAHRHHRGLHRLPRRRRAPAALPAHRAHRRPGAHRAFRGAPLRRAGAAGRPRCRRSPPRAAARPQPATVHQRPAPCARTARRRMPRLRLPDAAVVVRSASRPAMGGRRPH